MLLFELVQLQDTADQKIERQRARLSARQLRAELRERRRAEQALITLSVSRLC
ncbi:hypothetical protein ACFOVU_14900 [Nocardiopsis sediminis]|uniref:Uncharacterized protein n=1 Tax=Nocardiopsis sediminis TaxID=1778267 RepID=A0ABV8FMD2_9ACTN